MPVDYKFIYRAIYILYFTFADKSAYKGGTTALLKAIKKSRLTEDQKSNLVTQVRGLQNSNKVDLKNSIANLMLYIIKLDPSIDPKKITRLEKLVTNMQTMQGNQLSNGMLDFGLEFFKAIHNITTKDFRFLKTSIDELKQLSGDDYTKARMQFMFEFLSKNRLQMLKKTKIKQLNKDLQCGLSAKGSQLKKAQARFQKHMKQDILSPSNTLGSCFKKFSIGKLLLWVGIIIALIIAFLVFILAHLPY